MSSAVPSSWRPTVREHGWERPVAVPESLDELRGAVVGPAELPLRLVWSGRRTYDLAVERDRRLLYEIVLTEGGLDDVRTYVDGGELIGLWEALWLSPHVRRAWQPLIAATSRA